MDILYTNRRGIYSEWVLKIFGICPTDRRAAIVRKVDAGRKSFFPKKGQLRLAISFEPFVVRILFFASFDSAGDSLRESNFSPQTPGRTLLAGKWTLVGKNDQGWHIVRSFTIIWHTFLHEYRHIIYQSTQNLSVSNRFVITTPPDQPSGRYWPESGRNWEKTLKNDLFFKVFGKFIILPYILWYRNFKRG